MKYWMLSAMLLCAFDMICQVASEAEVIRQAIEHYPSLQIANLEVQRRKALEKTAFNPEQPQFAIEIPSDVGLVFEVEQEFSFPTIYAKRKKWLKSETQLAAEIASLTQNELTRDVRMAYLDVQIAQQQFDYFSRQDSLWKEIVNKSQRLYDAGEINKADLIFAEKQSGLIEFSLLNAGADRYGALSVLNQYLENPVIEVEEIKALPINALDSSAVFYFNDYLKQNIEVAENEIELSRAHRLPDLLIGYLRAPEPDTEFRYRFKTGITIPIWQGQYTGEVEAAKVNMIKAQAEADLKEREAKATQQELIYTIRRAQENLKWFESKGLTQMNELVDIYRRLYDAGEVDYALTLRNIADAFSINTQYLETLKMHNRAVIELEFLQRI